MRRFKTTFCVLGQKFDVWLLTLALIVVLVLCRALFVSHSNNNSRQKTTFPFPSFRDFPGFLTLISTLSKDNGNRFGFILISWLKHQALPIIKTIGSRVLISSLTPVTLSRFPVSRNSIVRKDYASLVSTYLQPHLLNGQKISRHSFLNPFQQTPGVCTACALIQVRNGSVYVHDPHGVRAVMAPFRAQRLREVVYWVTSSVARGVVDNFEFVISTMDPIPTTSRSHSYRLPRPSKKAPIFAPVYCNVSDNIPFPVMLTDVLRRGLPDVFANRSHGTLAEWDETMEHFSNGPALSLPWTLKMPRAVFRGTIRSSAFVQQINDFNELCHAFGRTALWEVANRQSQIARKVATAIAKRFRMWPLPTRWFQPRFLPVLDVQLDGTCGGKLYVANQLNSAQQVAYKYVIHAAGNFFWADRLLMTMFGSNVILKQVVPCGMFFEPMLRPFYHFIPINANFSNTISMIEWAYKHDETALQIVQRARRFAGQYLSTAGVQTYVDELLSQYANGLENRSFFPITGAVRVFP